MLEVCANCGFSLMRDVEPPRHMYGLRRCKRQPFDPEKVPGPEWGLLDDVFATPAFGAGRAEGANERTER